MDAVSDNAVPVDRMSGNGLHGQAFSADRHAEVRVEWRTRERPWFRGGKDMGSLITFIWQWASGRAGPHQILGPPTPFWLAVTNKQDLHGNGKDRLAKNLRVIPPWASREG